MVIFGIDYGSKLAGTTVIARLESGNISLSQSEKKEDADLFISTQIHSFKPTLIMLDAPLSLPGVYNGHSRETNFFYRKADILTQAMSPMFLGGITARAMQLKHLHPEAIWKETYPSYLQKIMGWNKTELRELTSQILAHLDGYHLDNHPTNKHQLDALCALISGIRYTEQRHLDMGSNEEGIITI